MRTHGVFEDWHDAIADAMATARNLRVTEGYLFVVEPGLGKELIMTGNRCDGRKAVVVVEKTWFTPKPWGPPATCRRSDEER